MKLQFFIACLLGLQCAPVKALDCKGGGHTQGDMNYCANLRFESADAELNRKFKNIMACFKPFPGQEKPFVEAQRAWIKFRDAECKLRGSGSEGGSVQPMIVSSCLDLVTRQRQGPRLLSALSGGRRVLSHADSMHVSIIQSDRYYRRNQSRYQNCQHALRNGA